MAEIRSNPYGSAVIGDTGTHVAAVGFAHEGGASETELLAWFSLTRVQLHGALAYFYQHRDELRQRSIDAGKEAAELSCNMTERLAAWRKQRDAAQDE